MVAILSRPQCVKNIIFTSLIQHYTFCCNDLQTQPHLYSWNDLQTPIHLAAPDVNHDPQDTIYTERGWTG